MRKKMLEHKDFKNISKVNLTNQRVESLFSFDRGEGNFLY